eukprot:jgi/Botrbrau1/13632/Bobra.0373s0009.2
MMREDTSTSPSAAMGLSALAARLGRGSPAGMAVAFLYNLNHGKDLGNYYSSRNKRPSNSSAVVVTKPNRTEGTHESRKHEYKVPRFVKRGEQHWGPPKRPGRRPEAVIVKHLEDQKNELWHSILPLPQELLARKLRSWSECLKLPAVKLRTFKLRLETCRWATIPVN